MSFIYLFILGYLLVMSILELSRGETNSQLYRFIVAIMILTAGLAYGISPDWISYYKAFSYLQDINWADFGRFAFLSGMEKGYLAFNKIIGGLGFDFGGVTLLLVFTSLYLKSKTFFKYGGLAFLALFIYSMPNFMFEEHVHIRQGLANAIGIYSVRYIIDRKLIKFLICIVIAYQFHQAVIVFLLAYWVAPMKFNETTMGWLVVLSIVGFYTGLNSIIDIFMQFMPVGQDKFESYQSQLGAEGEVAVGDFVKIISVLSIIIYNKYADHDRIYCYFRNLFLMGTLLYFFLGKGIFGIRLPGFYLVFLGMTISRMLYVFSGNIFKKKVVFFSFTFYTVLLIFWFQVKQAHKSKFSDYKTIFNKDAIYGIWK